MAQNINTAKQWLKESDAEMLVYRVVAYSSSEEILRGWPASKIPKDRLEICKAYLMSRGSEKNNKQSWTIKDPLVDKEEWLGTWQHYDEGWQTFNRQPYLVQTIRKGYYQDVPYQATEISGDRTVSTRQQLRLTTQTPEPIVAVAGQIKSQNVNVNEGDGTKTVRTDRDVGTAQEVINTVRAPDATTVITDKTVQDAQVTVPALQAGVLKRIRSIWSRYYSRWTTTEEVETGIAQTVATTTNLTGTERTVVTEKTVQSVALVAAAFVAGTIRRIINAASKYPSRYTTVEDVKTAIAVSIPEVQVRLSEQEVAYRSEEKHAASAPDITKFKPEGWASGAETSVVLGTNASSVSLTHNLDDFLRHNYVKTRVVKSFPFTGEKTWKIWGSKEVVTSQVYSETLGRYWNNRSYTYHLYREITVKYFKTQDEAIAYVHSAGGTEAAGSGFNLIDSAGSGWTRTGEYEYEGRKVRNKKSLLTSATVNYLEPTS